MIAARLRWLDIPFLDWKCFRQVTMSWTSDILIKFVWLATWNNVWHICLMGKVKSILLVFTWCCWWCLCRPVNMPYMLSLTCCSLDWGTLGWLLLGWGDLISHFWIENVSGKLPCLGLVIFSLNLWIFVWPRVETTSHALIMFLYISFNVPDVFICGAYG